MAFFPSGLENRSLKLLHEQNTGWFWVIPFMTRLRKKAQGDTALPTKHWFQMKRAIMLELFINVNSFWKKMSVSKKEKDT